MYKEKIVGEVAHVLDTAGKILAEHFKPENKADVAAVILAGKLAEVSADWFDPFGRRPNVVTFIWDKLYEEVPEGERVPAESIIRDLILNHLHAQQAQQATAVDVVAREVTVMPPPPSANVDLAHAIAELNSLTEKVQSFGSQLSGIKQP